MAIQNFSPLQLNSTLSVGVDDTGYDVKFYGDGEGEFMQWDTSEAKLKIIHTDEAVGLEVYTNAAAQTTQPQLKVGRAATEYWGAYCADRTAHLVHRQDETSGSPNTSFEIWDSNTTDSAAYWVWRHANGSGGSLTEKMRLTKAGVLSVAELDISGNIDIDGITNLDAVDIDGAVQIDATLTVGVDDTGHDVKFYGATSGKYMLWDESADSLMFPDSTYAQFGTSGDLSISHNGSTSLITNYTGDLKIVNNANDKDIIFQSDDGSGGVTEYFRLDGGLSSPYTVFPDNSTLTIGTGFDLKMYHNGSNSYIDQTGTGNLYIRNTTDDADIIFQTDDNSGGVATYFYLDGSIDNSNLYTVFPDNAIVTLGTGYDFQLYHDSSDSYMVNSTGDLHIRNAASDGDILFRGNDGGSGITALTLDMSDAGTALFNHDIRLTDNGALKVGSANDLQILHDGSNSYISNHSGGHLYIQQNLDDQDIVLQCDDGSGGTTAYLTLDGSQGFTTVQKKMRFADNIAVTLGAADDLSLFHDGTNSSIVNAVGNLTIGSGHSDRDIIFKGNDGGSTITALTLDMSAAGQANFNSHVYLPDDARVKIGASHDLQMWHQSGNSFITNSTGNLYITNYADDKPIIFQSDDGAGGTASYFQLHGSAATHDGSATTSLHTLWPDNSRIVMGTGSDFYMRHSGSDFLMSNATGTMGFYQQANDGDMKFYCDDGSGGNAVYLTLDGGAGTIEVAKAMNLAVPLATASIADDAITEDKLANTLLAEIDANTAKNTAPSVYGEYIKLLPNDFETNGDGGNTKFGAAFNKTAGQADYGMRTSASNQEMFAFVNIPQGYKATKVEVYGRRAKVVEVFEVQINATTVVSKGTGNCWIPSQTLGDEDITLSGGGVTSTATNLLMIEVVTTAATGDRMYGGRVLIEAI